VNRNTLLGILLIFAIFFLSERFIWKKAKPQPVKTDKQEQTTPAETTTQPDIKPTDQLPLGILPDDPYLTEVNDNIVLENDSLKLVFSNKGAVIREAYLKEVFTCRQINLCS